MIHGAPTTNTVMSILAGSPKLEFFPTGSQAIGLFGPHSDRDYFIKYSWEVEDFLKRNNFKKIDLNSNMLNQSYRDPSIVSIWERLCVVEQRNIQIQVIKPEWMDTKYRANVFFTENPKILSRLMKRQRAEVWRAIMAFDKAMNVDPRPRGTIVD